MELNRALIKQQARQLIKGKVFILFLIIFVVGFLTGGISGIFSYVKEIPYYIQNPDTLTNFSGNVRNYEYSGGFSFGGILTFVFWPLAVALAGMFLQFIRGTQFDLGGEFTYVFKNTFDKNYVQKFLLKLLVAIFTGLWCILFIIPGIVYHYKTYFVDFIMADNPEMTWKETIELSKKMTNGHKGELFVFDLSFILWYMLVGFTFFIAGIYVYPYIATAQALYYENFKARGLQTGELNETDFLSASQKAAQAYNNNFGNAQQPYQAPVQQPMGQPYQAPVQPQYQPPVAPVAPVAQPVEQPIEAPVQEAPVVENVDNVAEDEAPQESFYTPPADVQQYFSSDNTEDNQQ